MRDNSRSYTCINCNRILILRRVRVRCPYCDKEMSFPLPEYEFHDGQIGCEHCHRRSHLRIGGYWSDLYSTATEESTAPFPRGASRPIVGGRLLSIVPTVPPELILGISRKIPDAPRQDLDSAVKCLEISEFTASAILCRRCVQAALKIRGIPDNRPMRMIHIAHAQGMLSEIAKRQAEAVTFMGDKAAHPQNDPLLNLSESDIKQGLQMVRRILLELFDPDQLPVT